MLAAESAILSQNLLILCVFHLNFSILVSSMLSLQYLQCLSLYVEQKQRRMLEINLGLPSLEYKCQYSHRVFHRVFMVVMH